MICIFCKQNSDASKGVEHIIPESLGNVEHILPRGRVCDKCNSYFATKIEKHLLDQPYFKSLRHWSEIRSKKGNLVPIQGFIPHPQGGKIDVYKEGSTIFLETSSESIENLILGGEVNTFVMPMVESEPKENDPILSRFLAKVAVEALLYKVVDIPGLIDEVINKNELDDIKKYARYGNVIKFWPYSQRRIYKEEDNFLNLSLEKEPYEILHEFQFLSTKEDEFYFVLAIAGIEYAINLGGPSVETYEKWLVENNNRSVLQCDEEQYIPGRKRPFPEKIVLIKKKNN